MLILSFFPHPEKTPVGYIKKTSINAPGQNPIQKTLYKSALYFMAFFFGGGRRKMERKKRKKRGKANLKNMRGKPTSFWRTKKTHSKKI